jgi:hypothetical protein
MERPAFNEVQTLNALAMEAEAGGELALADLASGERHHGADRVNRRRVRWPSGPMFEGLL